MAEGGEFPFFKPFSFEYQGDIPGLEETIPQMFKIPEGLQSLDYLYKECCDGKVGTSRRISDFLIYTKMKSTLPLEVYESFDQKKNQAVCLVYYQKLEQFKGDFPKFIQEATLLKTLDHVNVHKFLGIVYGPTVDKNCLMMDHFDCYLSQLLEVKNELLFQAPVVKCIFHQILNGLVYLHDQGVVHRDLTPKNVGINEKGIVKISNFRSFRELHQSSVPVITLEFGYQPVDMLLGSTENNLQIDVWSASCIFAELLLKEPLFKVPGREGVLNGIFAILGFPTSSLWQEFFHLPDFKYLRYKTTHSFNCVELYFKRKRCLFTPAGMDLLQSGLIYNPENRFTAKECIESPYFLEEPKACPPKFLVRILNRRAFRYPVEY